MDFKAGDVAVGERGSELKLDGPGKITLSARVAALLNEKPDPRLRGLGTVTGAYGSGGDKPFWSVERARIDGTREVTIEALVNGVSVAQKRIVADGGQHDIGMEVPIEKSSWVALRILPAAHTNPIFVVVNNKPIREKRSIKWCLKSVDQCWAQKEKQYEPKERDEARAAYDKAREVYRARLAE